MDQIQKIKKELEDLLTIAKWSPSTTQISKISTQIADLHKRGEKLSKSKIEQIVLGICENITFRAFEGLDNSDINTLLLLAISLANKKS